MPTALTARINYVDASHTYIGHTSDYIALDLANDYLIWTAGSSVVKDLMTHEPTADELNAAASIIDPSLPVTVPLCLLMDYSHDIGGSYWTHKVIGMGENKQYVFCFSFDGATATEPQLEAWDDTDRDSFDKNVLGSGTANNSFVKAVCTTYSLPGAGWVGAPIAGGTNVLLLNGGSGAIGVAGDLYANIKIVIPVDYSTPAAETYTLSIRYAYI